MSENPYAPYTVTRKSDQGEVAFIVSGPCMSLEYDDIVDANRVAFAASVAFNAGKSDATLIDGSPKNPAAFEALYRTCVQALDDIESDVHISPQLLRLRESVKAALALADKGVGQ